MRWEGTQAHTHARGVAGVRGVTGVGRCKECASVRRVGAGVMAPCVLAFFFSFFSPPPPLFPPSKNDQDPAALRLQAGCVSSTGGRRRATPGPAAAGGRGLGCGARPSPGAPVFFFFFLCSGRAAARRSCPPGAATAAPPRARPCPLGPGQPDWAPVCAAGAPAARPDPAPGPRSLASLRAPPARPRPPPFGARCLPRARRPAPAERHPPGGLLSPASAQLHGLGARCRGSEWACPVGRPGRSLSPCPRVPAPSARGMLPLSRPPSAPPPPLSPSPHQWRTCSCGGTCPRPARLSAASPPCTCCWSGESRRGRAGVRHKKSARRSPRPPSRARALAPTHPPLTSPPLPRPSPR